MTIYEINNEIQKILDGAIDEETGELLIDTAELEKLQMDRMEKLEHCAAAYKNYTAEIVAVKAVVDDLNKRIKRLKSRADSALNFLEYNLGETEEISSPRVRAYRKTSKSTETDEYFVQWAEANRRELLRYKEPEANKTELAKLLKAGEEIPHAWIAENHKLKVE